MHECQNVHIIRSRDRLVPQHTSPGCAASIAITLSAFVMLTQWSGFTASVALAHDNGRHSLLRPSKTRQSALTTTDERAPSFAKDGSGSPRKNGKKLRRPVQKTSLSPARAPAAATSESKTDLPQA